MGTALVTSSSKREELSGTRSSSLARLQEISSRPGTANGWLNFTVAPAPGCRAGTVLAPRDCSPALQATEVGSLAAVPVFLTEAVNATGCPTPTTARATATLSTPRLATRPA